MIATSSPGLRAQLGLPTFCMNASTPLHVHLSKVTHWAQFSQWNQKTGIDPLQGTSDTEFQTCLEALGNQAVCWYPEVGVFKVTNDISNKVLE